MGWVEQHILTGDWHSEELKQFTHDETRAPPGASAAQGKQPRMRVATPTSIQVGRRPTTPDQHRALIKLMGIAWVTHSMTFPSCIVPQGLHPETFIAVGELVLGKDCAGIRTAGGAEATWEDVLNTEFAARKTWWEMVDMGYPVNQAILLSTGANPHPHQT